MSNELIIPVAPVKLARRAWMRIAGVLLLGVAGAALLGFYAYKLHRLDSAHSAYMQTARQYQVRTAVIRHLREMELSFNRYLLDGNQVNLGLLQADKQLIENLSRGDESAQHDQVVQNIVAAEQKWYPLIQPFIEERGKLAAGQGLPEDFLAKYRNSGLDLQVINFENTAEGDYLAARKAAEQMESELRWLWLPYPLAGLLIIGVIWLGAGAIRGVSHLKQAAENEGEEEEESTENPHDEEAK